MASGDVEKTEKITVNLGLVDLGTELCEAPRFQYNVFGTPPIQIQTADGDEFDAVPGQVTALPSGHGAWVVGDDPVVVVDCWGASDYARG